MSETDFNKILDTVFRSSRDPEDGRPRRFAHLAQTIETARNHQPGVFVATPHLAADRLSAIYALDEAADEAGDASTGLSPDNQQDEGAFTGTASIEQSDPAAAGPANPALQGNAKEALGYVELLSIEELHELRRKLALAYHPDRNAPELHASATEQMTLVNRIIDDALKARRSEQRRQAHTPKYNK